MKKTYPYYPQPIQSKTSVFMRYFKNKYSWLDGLYARSYTMKMGEFNLPLIKVYIANEPELIQRILVTEVKQFPKHPLQHLMMKPLLGESVFTSNGKQWKKQRELLNPSFEMVRVSQVFTLMYAASKEMMLRLESMENQSHMNVDSEMTFTTADIIFRTILSKKLTNEEGEALIHAFEVFQENSAKIAMQTLFKVPKLFQSRKAKRAYISSGKTIRHILSSIINPRVEAARDNRKKEEVDILSFLLDVVDEETGKHFTATEILDQISMLFLAGHETTASSMTWTLYLLALYPKVQEEAYNEIMRECGTDDFTIENTNRLYFVMKIFKESLRLYPPVNFLIRETAEDIEMRDKKIKKGSIMMVSPWLMHRNERFWEDPHMFNPHRFDTPSKIVKYSYFPFGMGQRVCIGAGFSIQETTLLLASILRKYRLELKPGFTPDLVGRLTTRSLNGMPIKLIKREKNL